LTERLRFALRSLRGRNLRIFFTGHGISLVGTWMQQLATAWLVYRLTGSAVLLGVIAFTSQIPSLFLAPFAGAVADRYSRYRLVVIAQSVSMVLAVVLAALVLSGRIEVWHLLALSLVTGVVAAVDVPARQALIVGLVDDPSDLPNAIALNSAMFNGARLIGPAIAGLLIGWVGEGPVFIANAASFIAVLVALRLVKVRSQPPAAPGSVLESLRAGWKYAAGSVPIRALLLMLAGLALVGLPYTVLLPVFAQEVLGGDARTLGFLTSSAAAGALIGTLYLASRQTIRGLGRLIMISTGLFGLGLVLFSISRAPWLGGLCLVLTGFGGIVASAGINTVLQTLVDEEMRGRVMSLYMVAFMGTGPIGALAGGWLAAHFGAPSTLALGGAGCLALSLWFSRVLPAARAAARPVLESRGVLPEVATGVSQATWFRPRS
jgi:MFS family permease